MCGIFGVISSKNILTLDQEKFVASCTLTGQLRGEDGTGIFVANNDGSMETYKRALPGADFFYTTMGKRARSGVAKAKLVIGHNRKGTSGANDNTSCHPFVYDNLTGVHNGTVPWSAIDRLDTKGYAAQVDSAKIYSAMDKVDDPIEVLSKIHTGSYALNWFDHRTNTLNFARNKDRPMFLANGADGMYWASEAGMLYWLMTRYGLESKSSTIYQLDTEALYSFNLDDYSKPEKKAYKVDFPKPVQRSYPASRGGYNNANNNTPGWLDRTLDGFRSFKNVAHLRRELPQLKHVADAIEENYEWTAKNSSKGQVAWNDYLDVVVTDYTYPAEKANAYPDVWGYVADEAQTGATIPVRMPAVSEAEFGLIKRLRTLRKKGTQLSFPTLRMEMTSMKVYANGQLVVQGTPDILWNKDNDQLNDESAEKAQQKLADLRKAAGTTWAKPILKTMWQALTSTTTPPPVSN